MISRRTLLCSSGSLLGLRSAFAQPMTADSLKVTLAREFAHARLLHVSPDGTKLCLEDWNTSGYPIRVVELGTGKIIFIGGFRQRALEVGFFADGQALFLGFAGGKGGVGARQIMVDLKSGEATTRTYNTEVSQYFEFFQPIHERELLVTHYAKPGLNVEWLARFESSPYHELQRAKLSAGLSDSASISTALSDDRSVAVYIFDGNLVMRRTRDLEILWTRDIEAGFGTRPLRVSAHGDYVVASVGRPTGGKFDFGRPGRFTYPGLFIGLYDGKTGDELTRLPLDGSQGPAISPDGKLLAVSVCEAGRKGDVLPAVHLYNVASGARIATVFHDRIPPGRHQWLVAGCSGSFTADGRYLVTAGMVTKVWNLGEAP